MMSTSSHRLLTRGQKMLTLEQIKIRIKTANIQALALAAGAHPNTLYSINAGRSPSYKVVKKLSDYFEKLKKKKRSTKKKHDSKDRFITSQTTNAIEVMIQKDMYNPAAALTVMQKRG